MPMNKFINVSDKLTEVIYIYIHISKILLLKDILFQKLFLLKAILTDEKLHETFNLLFLKRLL